MNDTSPLRTGPVQRYVTSRDGTRIGYLQQGSGPGIVLVQGAMGTAHHYSELAEALSDAFTVYSADRRGRGSSPKPYEAGHTVARDVEDVDAILTATDSHFVFGLSSGAVITLQAAEELPRITKAAVYEPPFYDQGISHEGIRRLGHEIEHHRYGSALIDSLLTAQTAPTILRLTPRPLARALGWLTLRIGDLVTTGPDTLRAMLPGIRYDFTAVGSMDGEMASLSRLDKPVLLLSGTRSPTFLHDAVGRLETVLPDVRRVDFDGLSHSGPWNQKRGGRSLLIAEALRDFLAPESGAVRPSMGR